MNKQLYKKVRIIHDAPNDRFVIEAKTKIFGDWRTEASYHYKIGGRDYFTEHHIPQRTEEEAKRDAIARAQALKTKTIIWEG